MKTQPYAIQYFHRLNARQYDQAYDPDFIDECDLVLADLIQKAIRQSGLTSNELLLIYRCRKYNIFPKVNMYAHTVKKQK